MKNWLKYKGILAILITFFSSTTTLLPHTALYEWAIVGGGPAGIIAIGVLMDLGVEPSDILWFDPEFNVGRMGKYYRNVPANSRAQEIAALLRGSPSFAQYTSESISLLQSYPPFAEFHLRMIVDPFKDITNYFFKAGVIAIQAMVTDLIWQDGSWQITAENIQYNASKVILAGGSEPIEFNYPGPTPIPLDFAMDKSLLAPYLTPDDVVAVVGSGASAILLLKYLSELPVKKVINFFKYHHSKARQRSLIRGETAQWIKDVLDKAPPANLVRLLNSPENRALYLPECTKIIYAVGYQHNPLPRIVGMCEPQSPNKTGILGPHLFGFGFAFPEELTYMSSQELVKVPLVGVTSFMNFAKRVIPEWRKQ